MKRFPKYGEPGFYREVACLKEQPTTAAEVYRQLCALSAFDYTSRGTNPLCPSKRRYRLRRMYYGFKAREAL